MSVEQRIVYTSFGKEFDSLAEAQNYEDLNSFADTLKRIVDLRYEDDWGDVLWKLREIGFDVVNTLEGKQ